MSGSDYETQTDGKIREVEGNVAKMGGRGNGGEVGVDGVQPT